MMVAFEIVQTLNTTSLKKEGSRTGGPEKYYLSITTIACCLCV